jgi:hypothetical protein
MVTERTARRLAWAVFGVIVLIGLGGVVSSAVVAELPLTLTLVAMLPFPIVGMVIASRQPRNSIGWILLAIGLVWALGDAAGTYSTYGLTHPGALPGPDVALILSSSSWVPGIGLIGTFLILLFPDGHLPSPRWRPWAWFCALALLLPWIAIILEPGPIEESVIPNVENPLGIESLRPLFDVLLVSVLLIPLSILGCALSLIQRFRRSRGRERLQLKWLAAAAGVCASIYFLAMSVSLNTAWGTEETPLWIGVIQNIAFYSFVLIPLAVGVAILRHRLYDIDRIINRTLVYGVVTAVLALGYTGAVLGLQALLPALARDSAPAVAVSTLAMVGLFRPVRNRVQGFVDRRFFRRRYDATRTVEAFGSRLRQETDLESLRSELLGLVEQTMQPASLSLWLRPPE